MAASEQPRRKGFAYRLPIIGTILRDIDRDFNAIFYLIGGLICLTLSGAMIFGLHVLTLVALVMVFVMFCAMIAITQG